MRRHLNSGLAAWGRVGVMKRLVKVPRMARKTQIVIPPWNVEKKEVSMPAIAPPAQPPMIMATKVHSWVAPFAAASLFGGFVSGRNPYFAGAKKALCVPMQKRTRSIAAGCPLIAKSAPMDMMRISATFVHTITTFFETRSARYPASAEKRR